MQRNGHQHWSWRLPAPFAQDDEARSNNLALWRQNFEASCKRLDLQSTTLGSPLGHPLVMAQRPARRAAAPRRLVACGFHGEEPAGPWGLLHFLQHVEPAALDNVHLTLLPLVNVTGFIAGTRFNAEGDNPNRGFSGAHDRPSSEGHVLLQHASTLAAASRDGALSCHEDVLSETAYIYALEQRTTPSLDVQRLLQTNLRHFEKHPDGLVDNCRVQDGVIFNHHDGSFEDWLFGMGARYAACVETPALHAFERRVQAQSDMIEAFLLAQA